MLSVSLETELMMHQRVSSAVRKLKKSGDRREFFYTFKCCKPAVKRSLQPCSVKEVKLEGN